MANLFCFTVECGSAEAKVAISDHFRGILPGSESCDPGTKAHWFTFWPHGITSTGIRAFKEAKLADEAARVLYDRLKEAPAFRYATVGVECDSWLDYDELLPGLCSEEGFHPSGLVISEQIWTEASKPKGFVPFANGYWWVPYTGNGERVKLRDAKLKIASLLREGSHFVNLNEADRSTFEGMLREERYAHAHDFLCGFDSPRRDAFTLRVGLAWGLLHEVGLHHDLWREQGLGGYPPPEVGDSDKEKRRKT